MSENNRIFRSTAEKADRRVCVAPMMAWTDRHCRRLHRLYSPDAVLFTEMVTTGALVEGNQWHQLDYTTPESPVAVQLGGSNPHHLARCAQVAAERGYVEVNLNVGCPSDRVQRGTFGACLMREPQLVADCVKAMKDACDIPVTVKCRLGVDGHNSDELLQAFVDQQVQAGCDTLYLHMRIAILQGLSPAQNRSIPPLQPERAHGVRKAFPDLHLVVNGEISTVQQATTYLDWADGVMVGRAAYNRPELLGELQQAVFASTNSVSTQEVLTEYRTYMESELSKGTPLHAMTKHLLHCVHAVPGARRFRQLLSDQKLLKTNNLQVFDQALEQVWPRAA